jgi:glycosyltransferase involved in cell wall biosynthesis
MVSLSAAIITLNEEQNIARCINSLQGIADEIIVVDSFSSDKTEEICMSFSNVKFFKNKFIGHIQQKNYAFSKASGEFVLGIDADEVVSPELRNSILKVKENPTSNFYSFTRLNNYGGHWVKHCGWYPDIKLRLVKKGMAKWGGVNPHDILLPQTNDDTSFLTGDLLHYSYASIADHINQTNKFSSIAAESFFREGKRSSVFHILTRPPLKFLKDYILKAGFLDGWKGLVICLINGFYTFLKYSKIYELQRKE